MLRIFGFQITFLDIKESLGGLERGTLHALLETPGRWV